MAITTHLPFMHRLLIQRARWARLVRRHQVCTTCGALARAACYLSVARGRVFLARLRAGIIRDRHAAIAAAALLEDASLRMRVVGGCLDCLTPLAQLVFRATCSSSWA